MAINLYVASSITNQSLERISWAVLPYLFVLISVLMVVVYGPILLGMSG